MYDGIILSVFQTDRVIDLRIPTYSFSWPIAHFLGHFLRPNLSALETDFKVQSTSLCRTEGFGGIMIKRKIDCLVRYDLIGNVALLYGYIHFDNFDSKS